MQRCLYALLLCASLLGASARAQVVLPGTQPGEIVNWPLLRPDQNWPTPGDQTCKDCHGGYVAGLDYEPFDSWAGSMMANSARDPLFWAALDIANQDAPGVGEFCIRCHAPAAWLAGRSATPDGSGLLGYPDEPDNDFEGIDCHFCHRMYEGPGGTPYTQNGQYFVDDGTPGNQPPRRGPFQLAFAPHEWQYSAYHESGEFCGACHDLRNPLVELKDENGVSTGRDFPEQLTYSEWAQSAFADEGTQCQDCHMPPPGVAQAFACSSFNPARPDPSSDNTPLARHDLAGANVFVLQILKGEYGDALGRTDAYDATIARALSQLQDAAATVEVTAPAQGVLGGEIEVAVRVTNLSGHKLPTGYPEGRRIWLQVVATDFAGVPFWQSGAYDDATASLIADSQLVVYETRHGIEGQGPSFHLVLNDRIFFDNRIPPRGFVPDADTMPVGASYPVQGDGSLAHWADESFTIPVPVGIQGPVNVTATLRYQTASREYIEFLRDENTSGPDPKDRNYPAAPSRGQKMHDLWSSYGKSAPIDMTFDGAAIPVVPAPSNVSDLVALPSHNLVHLSWTLPQTAAGVKVFRRAWSDYPQFGSLGSALPAPNFPVDIAHAQAQGWVEIYDGLGESFDDGGFDDSSRAMAFYAAFAYDAQAVSAFAAPGAQAKSTSYRLADIGEIGLPGVYDGLIDGLNDLPVFSLSYGAAEGEPGWNPECDFGPTDLGGSAGVPAPDDLVDFDDLLVFALQFGSTPAAKPTAPLPPMLALSAPTPPSLSLGPFVRGADGLLRAQLRSQGLAWWVRGVSLRMPAELALHLAAWQVASLPGEDNPSFAGVVHGEGYLDLDFSLLGPQAVLRQDGVLATLILDAATPPSFQPAPLAGWIGDRDGQRELVSAHLVADTPPSGGPRLTLSAARPNPFNPRTSFQLSLGRSGRVRATVHDIAGRQLGVLLDATLAPGTHELVWDGTDASGHVVASGVYLCRVEAAGEVVQRRMVLLK